MTKRGYKFFDLTMLTIIGLIIEGVLTFASNQTRFIVQGFSVSFVVLFSLIGMFRWNYLGVVPGLGCIIAAVIMQNSFTPNAYDFPLIAGNVVGVLSTLVSMIYLKKLTKEKIKSNFLFLIIYAFIGYASYFIGCSLIWSIFGRINLVDAFVLTVSRNLINILMSCIILIIANKVKDFLVDMDEYLVKLHSIPPSARLRKEINESKEQSLMSEVVGSKEINDIALLDGGTLSEEQLIKLNKNLKEKEGDNYGTRKS